MSIGRRIKHARVSLGLTIADLSERTGYSENAIEGWEDESGIAPSHHAVSAMAKGMGMDAAMLSGDPNFPHGYIEASLNSLKDMSPEDIGVLEAWVRKMEREANWE